MSGEGGLGVGGAGVGLRGGVAGVRLDREGAGKVSVER